MSRLKRVHPISRQYFLKLFIVDGDLIRQEAGDERVLLDGLRALLPRYTGRSKVLYRGEAAANRRYRAYGASWTVSESVARSFAETGFYRTSPGGSVLLVTRAPAEAILCAPAELDDRYEEQEYIVDRRYLKRVDVLAKYSQLTHAEFVGMRDELGHPSADIRTENGVVESST